MKLPSQFFSYSPERYFPWAGYLCSSGRAFIPRLGAQVPRAQGKNLVTIDWPNPRLSKGALGAMILWADSFGNLITNVSREEYGPKLEGRPILIKGRGWRIDQIHRTYGESRPGQPMALFGSGGLLEISVNRGNALNTLGLKPGDPITIKLL